MIRFLLCFISFLMIPFFARAQATEVGEVSILGMLMLLALIIGIPGVLSYGIRVLTRDNIASYFGTFIIVAISYTLARTMFGFIIEGSMLTVGLILLVPSMLGAILAQTVYYIRLPKPKL